MVVAAVSAMPSRNATRDVGVDRLKVFLIAAVIGTHCAITYGADGSWFYRETTHAGPVQKLVDIPIVFGALFAMGTFFYLAGAYLPASVDGKGPSRYAKARLVRLGLPVALFVFLIVPALELLIARVSGEPMTAGAVWSDQLRQLDAGPLWFAAALLLFSLAFILVRAALGLTATDRTLTAKTLLIAGVAIGVSSFTVRIWFRIDTFQVGSLHVWQWGQCLGLFTLGAFGGRQALASPTPHVLRACRKTMIVGAIALVALLAAFAGDLHPLGGGLQWQSALVAATEAALAVSAPIVLLDFCRRHDSKTSRQAINAYGAYVLQAPVIVVLALLLRLAPLPEAVKLLILTPAGIYTCFKLSALLRRSELIRRVL